MLRALGKQTAVDLEDAVQIILAYFQDVLAAGFDAERLPTTVEVTGSRLAGDEASINVDRPAAG